MGLKKDKKGIFFTTLVILIISLFMISYTFYSQSQERKSIEKRIETMKNFIFSTEEDLSRQMYASGFRTIFLIEKEIIEKGDYVSDVNLSFQESFFNGTLNGVEQELMLGVTFEDIKNKISIEASKTNVEIQITNPVLTISQEDPWNIKLSLEYDLLMEDSNNLASWNKTNQIHSYIPISGFEDPIYTLNTGGLLTNNITKSEFEFSEDYSNLKLHAQNSYYIASTLAPSFLDRLEGKTSPNIAGIESMVNLQKLSSQGISIEDKSVIDYIYFSESNPSKCQIPNTFSWLKIDSEHLSIYNASC